MTYQKAMKIFQRMCSEDCSKCFMAADAASCMHFISRFPEEAENILAKWEEDNPLITNVQQVNKMFKETFGITYHEAVKRPAWWVKEYVPKKGTTSERK